MMDHLKLWVIDLLDGINENQQNETCTKLLKGCGRECAKRNALPHMDRLKSELAQFTDMEEIVKLIPIATGAECTPEENGFIVSYNRGRGCDCALVRDLAQDGHVVSTAICNCTLGFHETYWSTMFDRPVSVELLETFLRGGDCCSQRITFM